MSLPTFQPLQTLAPAISLPPLQTQEPVIDPQLLQPDILLLPVRAPLLPSQEYQQGQSLTLASKNLRQNPCSTFSQCLSITDSQGKENKKRELEVKINVCEVCKRTYKGKNSRSILRRHLKDKHKIDAPRGTRWDNYPNRPKNDEERRQHMLESKRRWAKKQRAKKNARKVQKSVGDNPTTVSAPTVITNTTKKNTCETAQTTTTISDTKNDFSREINGTAIQILALISSMMKDTTALFPVDGTSTTTIEAPTIAGKHDPLTNTVSASTTSDIHPLRPSSPLTLSINPLDQTSNSITTLPSITETALRPLTPVMRARVTEVQRSSPCHYAFTRHEQQRYAASRLRT